MEPSTKSKEPSFYQQTPAYKEQVQQTVIQVATLFFDQWQLLPGSTTKQQLGNIVTVSHKPGEAYLYADTIPTSTTGIIRVEVRDDYGRVFLPQPECAVYTGVSSTVGTMPQANAWPNASYAMNNFPVSIIPLDGAYSDDTHSVTTFAIRNNSGADVPVVVAVRWRLITNSASSFEQSDSSSV